MSSRYQAALKMTPTQTRISKADVTTEIARGIIESEAKARTAQIERLRALRLEKEAAEAKAAEKAAKEAAKAAAIKKTVKKKA